MWIKPYGDTLNDGMVQLSFTLPLAASPKAEEAARRLVRQMGFSACEVVHCASLADDFSFFVLYAKSEVAIDSSQIPDWRPEPRMDFYQINELIKKKIGRVIVVVGACTGSDAHTVGIDAIMNMKGYDRHYGLERYPMIQAHNLGAQVKNEELIEYAEKVKADALLISQIVTQKDIHLKNLTELIELLEAEKLRSDLVVCIGGPRINHKIALELGFDAGFGRGTYPEDVAAFMVRKLMERIGMGG